MARTKILSIGGGSVFASGGVTNNVIPKSNGSSQLADSALTDNGTNVISTEAILGAVGSSTLPGYAFTGGATQNASGMWWVSGSVGIIATNGATGWLTIGANNSGIQTGAIQSIGWSSTSTPFGNNSDLLLGRRGAANMRMGAADLNGVPVAQTLGVQNAITGSDLAGSTFTIDAPLGTGLGAGAKIVLNRALMKATGATAQTSANAFAVCESKTLSNTSATLTTLATIGLASNSGGGAFGIITVVSTDGTNFDTDSQSFNVSFVNKAGVLTISTAQITTASPASNSGSTTCGITITAGASLVNINVTPVFVTIVPTTVTAYLQLFSNGAGAITAL